MECGGVYFTSLSKSGADKGASRVFKVVFEVGGVNGGAIDLWDDKVFFGGGTPPWSGMGSGDLVDVCLLVVFLFVFVIPPAIFFVFFNACSLVLEGSESIGNICGAGVLHPYAEMFVCIPCVTFKGATGGVGVGIFSCLEFVDCCQEGIEPVFDPSIFSRGTGHWGSRSGCKRWGRCGS